MNKKNSITYFDICSRSDRSVYNRRDVTTKVLNKEGTYSYMDETNHTGRVIVK